MTIKYTYKCPACNHTYIEQRAADESQFFTTCANCELNQYEEVSVEVISETVERNPGGKPVIEEVTE